MRRRSFFGALAFGLALGIAVLAQPRTGRADTPVVKAAYDLFETDASSTSFPGLGNLMGVPLGAFNFGGAIGTKSTGQTDTIIQRLSDASVTANPPPYPQTAPSVGLVMLALQLETVVPVNFGVFGLDNYFVTLSPSHGAVGSISITFSGPTGGTFSSNLDVFFDIHKGALNGPVVVSSDTLLTSSGTAWGRNPPAGAVVIPGVNQFLLGPGNPTGDFWVGGELHNGPHGVFAAEQSPGPPPTPEPASLVLLSLGALGFGAYALRRRKLAA